MSNFLPCSLHISKGFCTERSFVCRGTTRLDLGCWRSNEHKRFAARIHCCSTTSTTSSQSLTSITEVAIEDRSNKVELKNNQFEYLVNEFGWRVRRLAQDQHEMMQVAQLQAEAFHTPSALFDDLFFEFFKAEVLSGLLYKLRNSAPDRSKTGVLLIYPKPGYHLNRYACLVAESAADSSKSDRKLVGIVDATVVRDQDVLQHLGESQEYLYVSGIAVSESFRRQKIATVLLKACDVLSALWGLEHLALRAYEDDLGARKLYANAGYRVVSGDPQWMAWMGRRRRVLMVKRSKLLDNSLEFS